MKALLLGLLVLLVGLQFVLWAGDKNVFELRHLRQQVADTQSENQALRQQNDRLAGEVIELKQGGEAVEAIARQELGFIKENETFFQVIESPSLEPDPRQPFSQDAPGSFQTR